MPRPLEAGGTSPQKAQPPSVVITTVNIVGIAPRETGPRWKPSVIRTWPTVPTAEIATSRRPSEADGTRHWRAAKGSVHAAATRLKYQTIRHGCSAAVRYLTVV